MSRQPQPPPLTQRGGVWPARRSPLNGPTHLLFVYGTLMRAASECRLGADMRQRLERAGEWLGPATIAGRLYDRGRYPLLVDAGIPHELAHGEVYRLAMPRAVFAWLDPYEGVPSGRSDGREYARTVRTIRRPNAAPCLAWVYLSVGPVAGLRRIAEGRWRPGAARRACRSAPA